MIFGRIKSFTRKVIGYFLVFMLIYILSCISQLSTLKSESETKDKSAINAPETAPQDNFCLLSLSESEVFDERNITDQLDCRLFSFIRENYLIEAPNKPYNLEHPEKDPNELEGQNKIVLEILNNMKNGFFVECGALDGEYLSATLRLERDFGWRGLLVEPNSESFSKLKLKNRKAWIANLCLSPSTHPQMKHFNNAGTYPELSSLDKYGSHRGKIVQIPCFPTFSVLSALNVTTIDFFVLDIEGAELDVLKTIPFDKILIKVFTIEWNHIPEGKEELLRFMLSKGYKLAKDLKQGTANDFILVHESVPLPEKFQNASVLDSKWS